MFLFIHALGGNGMVTKNFNTSHVLIYQRNRVPFWNKWRDFNTSHVLIYPFSQFNIVPLLQQFQYISCSYLSRCKWKYYTGSIFQYISCSYLSVTKANKKYCCQIFQYISCSYLSLVRTKCMIVYSNFNTSHVLIYRCCFCLHYVL